MKRMILVLMLFGSAVFAQENTSYESALKLYQEGRFAESESAFMQVIQTQTDNKFALYNWGLAAYQAGQKGKALAAWRRALTIDPDFAGPRRALDFAATEMPAQVFENSTSGWEDLREAVLNQSSLDRFVGISVLLFLFAGFLGVRYFGARHRALRDETSLPPFPTVLILLSILLVISLFFTVAKLTAEGEARATVILSDTAVRSGPSPEDNVLFELIEGVEVILIRRHDEWSQITYPGGLTGWVPSAAIFQTSGGT